MFDWVMVDFVDRELCFDICYNVCWRHRIKRFDVCQYIFQSIFCLFLIGFLCRQKRCARLILREMKRLIDQHSDTRMLVSL